MKDRILTLQRGGQPNDADYARFIDWTEIFNQDTLPTTALGRKGEDGATDKEIYLGNEIRKIAMDAVRLRRRTIRLKQRARRDAGEDLESGTPAGDDEQTMLGAEEDEGEDEESETDDAAGEDEDGDGDAAEEEEEEEEEEGEGEDED